MKYIYKNYLLSILIEDNKNDKINFGNKKS